MRDTVIPFRYAEADALLTVLDQAGFGELHVHDWRGALALGGGLPAAAAARFALGALSSYKVQLGRRVALAHHGLTI